MKKFLFLLTVITAVGCSKNQPEIQPPVEVSVSLDYSFAEIGNMTKSGNSVYSNFYDKYVATKILAPKTFELTFTNKETGATATMRGNWDKNHSIKLLAGEYEVSGISHPVYPSSRTCIDSLYMAFNETLAINESTQSISLTAMYDCYLLLFDKGDKTKIAHHVSQTSSSTSYDTNLQQLDNIYYAYMYPKTYYNNLIYIYHDGIETPSSIRLNDIPFEKGKYYYFNDLSNSFDIPPMSAGN